ncbi:MAG: carbohydrate-binding protein [Phycisphaerales bacterium]|nr:carbohydrate-binding protein [Phycisphaerales bacterium]
MRSASCVARISLILASLALIIPTDVYAAPPAGFVAESRGSGWNECQGVEFMPDGHALVWERTGRVWVVNENGIRETAPFLDIHDEVGGWRDFGLMSVLLHPNFESNGWVYLLYIVDRHHLDFAGTGSYNPNTNTYYAATIGRVTRYTATVASGMHQVDPASRLVLLGESASTGIPVTHQSHSVGTLVWGEDGSLLLTTGDNASYESVDVGGQASGGWLDDAVARGIIRAKENVGAYRAQLVDCLCGKVLRLDPQTGNGLAGNPWFEPKNPRSPRSRVWCTGLRNPFRMSIVPESGSHDPQDNDPGTLLIGDVGWTSREDWQVADRSGLNFGWPLFEGLTQQPQYWAASPTNADAPIAGGGQYLYRDLVRQESLDATANRALNRNVFLQAELGTGTNAPVSATDLGFQGTGYRDFNAASGGRVGFTVNNTVAGAREWTVRYTNGGTTDRPLSVRVDGTIVIASVAFPSTGTWTDWRTVTIPLTLTAGSHTIELRTIGANGGNIDSSALHAVGAVPLIASNIPTFAHTRPKIDWAHGVSEARTPTFLNNAATTTALGGGAGTIGGSPFGGNCAIGGGVPMSMDWPAEWRDHAFIGDFGGGWIRALAINAAGDINNVTIFDSSAGSVVGLFANQYDGSLWRVSWPDQVVRYRYAPSANLPPTAVLVATPNFGPSPFLATLSAVGSSDPEDTALTYQWNYGDGTAPVMAGATVQHTYQIGGGAPTRFDATVTVRDTASNATIASVIVSLNNTPPVVSITSLADGQHYPMDTNQNYPLFANVNDAEHGAGALSCVWTSVLHHNTHQHPEPPMNSCAAVGVTSPVGCGTEDFSFEFILRVTDAAGLVGEDRVTLLPDCAGIFACLGDLNASGAVDAEDIALFLAQWNLPGDADLDFNGTTSGADLAIMLGNWGPC